MKPRNFKEINDRFWLFFLLYVVSLVLTGFVVHTSMDIPQKLEEADDSFYKQKYETLLNREKTLLNVMDSLNKSVTNLERLNKDILAGDVRAPGLFDNYVKKYNRELDSLRRLEATELQKKVVDTYEKIDELIDISVVFKDEKVAMNDELNENRRKLIRLENQLENCNN